MFSHPSRHEVPAAPEAHRALPGVHRLDDITSFDCTAATESWACGDRPTTPVDRAEAIDALDSFARWAACLLLYLVDDPQEPIVERSELRTLWMQRFPQHKRPARTGARRVNQASRGGRYIKKALRELDRLDIINRTQTTVVITDWDLLIDIIGPRRWPPDHAC